MYSPSITNLISSLKKLPSVGQRTAERYVFHWLKSGRKDVAELVQALQALLENVKSCEVCWDFSETSPCPICADKRRDRTTICVIVDPQDLLAIEKSGAYQGVYHVLRGTIDATDADSLEKIKASELFDRARDDMREIILALNPDLPGETTMLYLERELKNIKPGLVISRLARGLPMGADLQYADEITLSSAIKNRLQR